MKKFTAILCAAALLASLTGCNNASETSEPSEGSRVSSPISDSSTVTGDPDPESTGDPTGSDSPSGDPEPQKPDGEPTFLTAPDGIPIYTSEISEIYKGSDETGDKETITLDEAEKIARECGDFTVRCEGFVYGYIPERALNRVDDPEMFIDIGSGSFDYSGEMFDVNTGEGKCSTEFMRISIGDKFGTLTVKNAYTLFGRNYDLDDGFSDAPGAYLLGGAIEFEGDTELCGYMCVTQMNTLYGSGGDMTFYADGDSSVKVPNISSLFWDRINNRRCHFPTKWYDGYFGDGAAIWSPGNIYETDCDVSGLTPGDQFVKVKITVGDIKFFNDGNRPISKFVLKDLKVV